MVVSIVFCRRCGSTNVDVVCWENGDIARFRCSRCGHEATINGFTLGRVDLHQATVLEAAQDMAIYDKYNAGAQFWFDTMRSVMGYRPKKEVSQ